MKGPKMDRITTVFFWAFLAVLPAPLVAAEADKAAEAASVFDSVWGAEFKRIKATRDAKDDLDLALRLVAAAKSAANQPEYLAVLCEKAYELAALNQAGYPTAIQAMECLAESVPDKVASCDERIAEIRQKQFDAARGADRQGAGEALVEALLELIDTREAAGATAEAVAACRKATAVAGAIKDPRSEVIDARLKMLEQALRTAREIEDLKKQLEQDPSKAPARQRLIRLLLVDADDPVEAAKWVEGVGDAALAKYVPAAAKPLAEAPELACPELGDWYRQLADAAVAVAKVAMLNRAIAYYERFLELHQAEDMDRTKAKAVLAKLEADLAKLPTAAPVKTVGWIDLLAKVDPKTDAVGGRWRRFRRGVATAASGDWGRLMLPVAPKGSYELQVSFVRNAGDYTVGVILPVGGTGVVLYLSGWHGAASGLEMIDGKDAGQNASTVRPGTLQNRRAHVLSVKVLLKGDQAEITVGLDGQAYTRWRGAQSSLRLMETWALPQPGALGLIAHNCPDRVVVFREARLRMLSGEAKVLRQTAKSAPAAK